MLDKLDKLMYIMTVNDKIKIEVPKSFIWVLNQWLKWNEENKTGEFKLVFKDGGICGVEKKEYEKPPHKVANG